MKKSDMKRKFLAGLCVLWVAAGAAAQTQAVIRQINGTVEVKAPGDTAWRPARQGETLARSAMISTGFKSGAVIALGNSLVSVQALTRLSLEELASREGNEQVDLNLRTGRVRAEVKPPANGRTDFTVRSPSVTASVRGTAFEFDGLRLSVDEGRVHVTGGDSGGTYVAAGHSVSADAESGRTVSAAETAREELAPPLPAGLGSVTETPAPPPVQGNVGIGFDWDKGSNDDIH